MGDSESCSSRAVDFAPGQSVQSRKQRQKVEVHNEILCRLRDLNIEEANFPAFEDELWAHFSRLPSRYDVERAQDVLMHKRLLEKARDPACRPAIEVRLVQVHSASDGNRVESVKFAREADPQGSDYPNKKRHGYFLLIPDLLNPECFLCSFFCIAPDSRVHPPPAFGTLSDLELLHEDKRGLKDMDVVNNVKPIHSGLMHEITIATNDKPKLLTQLTSFLSEVGLNIQEAHAFSTTDGYSLDVFVVDGWALEETEQLRNVLIKKISKVEVVKVADFGVARVQAQSGVMTAETGTYRWMAPEVIEHKPYNHKADVFSFGVVLWELLTGKLPYENLTPLQAALGVVQKGLRPEIPKHTHPKVVELLERCWQQEASLRPEFSEILHLFQDFSQDVEEKL
ncbi:hypothetical protein COLO4_26070 [Corchorus olitorius]|uniref:Protein kinase domain-containing protein n=1 Tax=Corchorus olitorius TaxID=93759 RepID=A0A1R3HYM5_9ROSI|nr:hypothetical protein COLO4_26070 [Corchorus olitorius]